jgi:hypothetical protein
VTGTVTVRRRALNREIVASRVSGTAERAGAEAPAGPAGPSGPTAPLLGSVSASGVLSVTSSNRKP